MEEIFYLSRWRYPSDEMMISVSFERKNEYTGTISIRASPFIELLPDRVTISLLYSEEYNVESQEKMFRPDLLSIKDVHAVLSIEG